MLCYASRASRPSQTSGQEERLPIRFASAAHGKGCLQREGAFLAVTLLRLRRGRPTGSPLQDNASASLVPDNAGRSAATWPILETACKRSKESDLWKSPISRSIDIAG